MRYGRLAGGIVDLIPRAGRSDRVHGELRLDFLEAHILVEGPIGKGTFAVALRRSYIDAFFGALVPGQVAVAPRYWDYQGVLDQPVGGGRFRLVLYGSDDALDLTSNGNIDTSLLGAPSQRYWFHTLFASYQKSWSSTDLEAIVAAGPRHVETSGGPTGFFAQDLAAIDARLEVRHRPLPTLRVTAGLDWQSRYEWLRVDGPLPLTGDVVPSLADSPVRATESHGFRVSPALYAQADWQVLPRWSIVAGARADWFAGKKGTFAQPRLTSRIELAAATYLKLGAGLYYQPPPAPYDDPVLGNPALRPQRAVHLTAGVESRPFQRFPSLLVEASGFYKDLQNLLVASTDTVRDGDGHLRALRYGDEGTGRVYGGELLIRQESPRWVYGWISYTLSRSERVDHPGESARAFRFDQTHILTLVLGYHLPWNIDLGARFRYATGNPDTSLLTGIPALDADRGIYLPRPGPLFGDRLPDFWQLDVRIDKRFVFRSWILSIYLDFYNVTNNANIEGYTYSHDYTRRIVTGGLPIIPSFGMRATF